MDHNLPITELFRLETSGKCRTLHTVRPGFATCILLIACACGGGRGIEGDARTDITVPDGGDPALEDVAPTDPVWDGDPAPDAGCDPESHWTLQPRTIESVTLVDGIARTGSTQRLLVAVELRSGCEVLAGIEVNVSPGGATDLIGLAAFGWAPTGVDCPPVAPIVERVVAIEGREQGNLHVVVLDDHSPGGGLRLTYDRDPCSGVPECMCGPGTPPGTGEEWASCTTDCGCAGGLSCIGYLGLAGLTWTCARICSDFMDCEPRETCLPAILDGAPYVCQAGVHMCDEDVDCPPGFECGHASGFGACLDAREPPAGDACACPGDCPPGQQCVESVPGPTCAIPCPSGSWCPESPGGEAVCGEGFVCVYPD